MKRLMTKSELREKNLWDHYRMTLNEYTKLLLSQNFQCAICSSLNSGSHQNFYVDHCHVTGKVRGLLCQQCNLALGHFKDDVNIIKDAIDYIQGVIL